MIGKTISHYKILAKLGEGGMGVVYKAHDTKLKRDIAIKFLPRNITVRDKERERFKVEAQSAAALNHPNIGTVYAIEEVGDEVFIAMEYVEGHELKERIGQGALTPDESIAIAIQIADGLQEAHKKGIIHRDIKSANIMLTKSGQAKIMDFGLAKVLGSEQLTKENTTVGTAPYMSPEQARGNEVDHRTDIWSFGVVLYEMLTGRLPFKSDYEQATVYSILNEEPVIPDQLHANLKQVLKKALAKNPDDRYQSAGELAAGLRTGNEAGSRKQTAKQLKKPWMIAAAMVVFLAAMLYFFLPPSNNVKGEDPVKTIAVLPFVNMSSDPDQEYFSDGLSEELINVLAKNPKLRVTARTSSFSFKGVKADIKTIAEKLKVQHILEGSVRKSGNTLRITAQLIDVATDAHLWSETYDETMDNIFAVQDTISRSVAEAMKIVLLRKENVTQRRETDPEAYNAYLLGKHFFYVRSDLERATRYFRQVLSIDSGYAPAWVELSKIHSRQANDGDLPVDKGYQQARQEAEKALEFDPNLADAHAQVGFIKRRYGWDWSGADESYQRALKLDPGNAGVISGAAGLARTLGRFDEAVRLVRRSVELDPVSANWYLNLGLYSYYAGLLDESQSAYRKSLDLNPQSSGLHSAIGTIYLERGKPDSALGEMMKETETDWRLYGLALAYHSLDNKKESDIALNELVKGFQSEDAYQIAQVYAYRGESNKAFEWLERAYNQRDGGLPSIKGDPLLRKIEKDPRYAAFLKKMKLPL